jgi:biopolymer transport protein ExbD
VRIKRPAEEPVELNVTPIIDMVFLLLIFFLVATKFSDIERDVRVRPPGSASARPVTAIPDELVVNVARDGRILVGGQERRLEDVDALIAQAARANPHQSVIIRGDRDVVLQHAVDVLDLCEKRGVERTYLTTRQTGP